MTLRGESFVSRVSASFLSSLGLDELIASSLEEYEAIALSLAQNRDRLAAVKRRLAEARRTASLFDMNRLVRGIEAAYSEMQERVRAAGRRRRLCRLQTGNPPAAKPSQYLRARRRDSH